MSSSWDAGKSPKKSWGESVESLWKVSGQCFWTGGHFRDFFGMSGLEGGPERLL